MAFNIICQRNTDLDASVPQLMLTASTLLHTHKRQGEVRLRQGSVRLHNCSSSIPAVPLFMSAGATSTCQVDLYCDLVASQFNHEPAPIEHHPIGYITSLKLLQLLPKTAPCPQVRPAQQRSAAIQRRVLYASQQLPCLCRDY